MQLSMDELVAFPSLGSSRNCSKVSLGMTSLPITNRLPKMKRFQRSLENRKRPV